MAVTEAMCSDGGPPPYQAQCNLSPIRPVCESIMSRLANLPQKGVLSAVGRCRSARGVASLYGA